MSNVQFRSTAPTAPTPNSSTSTIPAAGTMADSNNGKGVIRIGRGRRRIDIGPFGVGNKKDRLGLTTEESEREVSKEEEA